MMSKLERRNRVEEAIPDPWLINSHGKFVLKHVPHKIIENTALRKKVRECKRSNLDKTRKCISG